MSERYKSTGVYKGAWREGVKGNSVILKRAKALSRTFAGACVSLVTLYVSKCIRLLSQQPTYEAFTILLEKFKALNCKEIGTKRNAFMVRWMAVHISI